MENPTTKRILKSLRIASGPKPHSLISEDTLMEAIALIEKQGKEIEQLKETIEKMREFWRKDLEELWDLKGWNYEKRDSMV